MLLTNDEEWGEWEMGDDFGFYQDLDSEDNDHYYFDSTVLTYSSSSSNLFSGGPPTPPSDISSSSCCSPYHHHDAIEDPQPCTLTSYPPILSSSTIDQLNEHALPWSLQDTNWVRIFSSNRDGTSFGHFMRSVRNVRNTIVVAKTGSGKVVGGFSMDVWSGRKTTQPGEERRTHAFLFVVEPPPPAAAATVVDIASTNSNKVKVSPSQQIRVKRFIPGLEDLASSPTGVLEFNFDALSLSCNDKIVINNNNNKEEVEVHIFKPSSSRQQAPLKQVCQLGKKFISLGQEEEEDADDDSTGMKQQNLLTIENSFSKGEVSMTLNDGRCIMEEFEVVDFEVYCLSDDDDD